MHAELVGEEDTRMGKRAGFEGTFTINRKDFGIETYAGAIGDEVTIMTALPQKAARICDTMTAESHPLDACIRVSSASELLYLIAPPHD